MSEPRKHHYCPRFFLSQFCNEYKFFALDKETGKVRPSRPENEAHQRDFYRIEIPGQDPYFLEKEFGKIEAGMAEALEHIKSTHTMPNQEGFNFLMNFLGLLAARTPWQRETWGGFMTEIALKVLHMSYATEERYKAITERIRKDGKDIPEVSWEDAKRFLQEGQFKMTVNQEYMLATMLQQAALTTDLLGKRNWCLVVNKTQEPFITSDNPVGLRWMINVPGPYSPGFGLRNTAVNVALTKDIGLTGTFEGIPTNFVMDKIEDVANFNNCAAFRATRHIYSSKEDFCWFDKDAKIRGFADLMAIEERYT